MILDEGLVIAVEMAGPTVSPIAVRFSYLEAEQTCVPQCPV